MPGVLQLEAMAQVAGILMMRQAENTGKIAYFMSAENVKWRKPVRPGDTLVIDVETDQGPRQDRQGQGGLLGRRRGRQRGRSHLHDWDGGSTDRP